MKHLEIANDLLKQVKSGESTTEEFMKKADFVNNMDPAGDLLFAAIEAKAIENQGIFGNKYLETFNRKRKQILGVQDDITLLTDEEIAVIKENGEKFTATMSDATGTVQKGIVGTNINALMQKYFYDSNILSSVDLFEPGKSKEEITDITNDRVAVNRNELTAPVDLDDTTEIDTLKPAQNGEISDFMTLSDLLVEIDDARTMAARIARMELALRNRVDANIIGSTTTDTDGANQFYSILNNKAATGSNRGSLATTVVGVGVLNHIDAINYTAGRINFFDPADINNSLIVGNWASINTVMRTLDANNRYYFDMQTRTSRDLMTGAALQINTNMPANTIGIWDMRNYKVKLAFAPKLKMIETSTGKQFKYFTAGDGTPTFAYKANPAKNGFRHFVLEADNNYAS